MSTMFADTLLIVFISVCTALLAEGITWVLVYRTDKYKRLKAEVEKQSKKQRQEEKLKNNNRDLSMVRMKSMFAIGFCFTALMGMFNSMNIITFIITLLDLMVEWWQSSLLLPFPTSKDCLIEICWGMTPQTAPLYSCIFSVPCPFGRTSRRFLDLPLHELLPNRRVDFLAHHLLLGSSLDMENLCSQSCFSVIQMRLAPVS
ncbi:calcium load-activated calcium channel isoform X2 [Erinaceus europaeus]|uniref:Calcium load-activated calcium channel n=1 Tax=Erinaceus europaeus TaxID=9365 RepID=A0A1S3WW92_ERIEU|nr:calcium load-activated calcium channel isoform X2 [Erinaceus europaeus]